MPAHFVDLTGQQFGFLTVLKHVGFNDARQSMWECICRCGKSKTARGSDLASGTVRRCGPDCTYKAKRPRVAVTTIGRNANEIHFR